MGPYWLKMSARSKVTSFPRGMQFNRFGNIQKNIRKTSKRQKTEFKAGYW